MATPIQYKIIPNKDKKLDPDKIIVDGINEPKDSVLGKIQNHPLGKEPKGWELLDAEKHAAIFPISGLGELPEGHGWYVKTK